MPTYKASEPRNEPELLPPGRYLVQVIAAKLAQSKANGTDMIELTLLEKESRNYIYDRLVFTEKAYFRIDQFFAATGSPLTAGEEVDVEPEDCLNRKGWVDLVVEEYNGKSKNAVRQWLLAEPKEKGPAKNPPPPKPKASSNLATDDIPFAVAFAAIIASQLFC